ncbi:hypothetical protein [Marinobacter sp.]|uniref:hypothetical protein n=1 Tax=Marinobacter sp. TaxID=50741 RepID=UPI0025C0EC24|nr:hypothetical protein [Marinobacter sp.]
MKNPLKLDITQLEGVFHEQPKADQGSHAANNERAQFWPLRYAQGLSSLPTHTLYAWTNTDQNMRKESENRPGLGFGLSKKEPSNLDIKPLEQ